MSATTAISIAAHHPWNRTQPGAPQQNRPYAEVLVGPNRRRIFCLVDSGADRILLDSGFAAKAGVNFATPTSYPMRTVGGPITVDEVKSVALEIEGAPLTDTCLFAAGVKPPLLGRVTFLNAFKVGFDPQGWLHT